MVSNMTVKSHKGCYLFTLEEIDWLDDCLCCEYAVDYCFTEGEPMVKYYPDGSGYPGSDPEFEISDIQIVSVGGQDGELELTDDLKSFLLNKFEEIKEEVIERISEFLGE